MDSFSGYKALKLCLSMFESEREGLRERERNVARLRWKRMIITMHYGTLNNAIANGTIEEEVHV